jgi:hypothetical protein
MPNFNSLNVDLNDETYFPADIYERSKNYPHNFAIPCQPCNDSLDEYASRLCDEILAALEI